MATQNWVHIGFGFSASWHFLNQCWLNNTGILWHSSMKQSSQDLAKKKILGAGWQSGIPHNSNWLFLVSFPNFSETSKYVDMFFGGVANPHPRFVWWLHNYTKRYRPVWQNYFQWYFTRLLLKHIDTQYAYICMCIWRIYIYVYIYTSISKSLLRPYLHAHVYQLYHVPQQTISTTLNYCEARN